MCKFIGKSNGRILCKLSKSEILRLYTIVHVAMETTKTSHFTCQSKSFISIFFTCQVSACELQPFSCHNLANDICLITDKTVFSHLNNVSYSLVQSILSMTSSSYVTSDQVVLFQINKSCCGDRGLGRWFNAAYTACKFLHRNLQIKIFLLRINLKRMGDRCKTEHENQWCGD